MSEEFLILCDDEIEDPVFSDELDFWSSLWETQDVCFDLLKDPF